VKETIAAIEQVNSDTVIVTIEPINSEQAPPYLKTYLALIWFIYENIS
jgi:hypothetical protein